MEIYGFLLSCMFFFCMSLPAVEPIYEAPHVDSRNEPTEQGPETWKEWIFRNLTTLYNAARPLAPRSPDLAQEPPASPTSPTSPVFYSPLAQEPEGDIFFPTSTTVAGVTNALEGVALVGSERPKAVILSVVNLLQNAAYGQGVFDAHLLNQAHILLANNPTDPLYKAMADLLDEAQREIDAQRIDTETWEEKVTAIYKVSGQEVMNSFIDVVQAYVGRALKQVPTLTPMLSPSLLDSKIVDFATRLIPSDVMMLPEVNNRGSQSYELNDFMLKQVELLAQYGITVEELLANPQNYYADTRQSLIRQMNELVSRIAAKKWTGKELNQVQEKFSKKVSAEVDNLIEQLRSLNLPARQTFSTGIQLLPSGLNAFEVDQPTFFSTMQADNKEMQNLFVWVKGVEDRPDSKLSDVQEKIQAMNQLSNSITLRYWSSFSYGPESELLNELQQEFATNVRNAVQAMVNELQKRSYKPSLKPDKTSWWNENLTLWDAVFRFVTRSTSPLSEFGKGQFTQAANFVRMAQQGVQHFTDHMQEVVARFNEFPPSTTQMVYSDYLKKAQKTLSPLVSELRRVALQEGALRALAGCKGVLTVQDVKQAFTVPLFEYSTDIFPVNPDQSVNDKHLQIFLEVVLNKLASDSFNQGDLEEELGAASYYQKSLIFQRLDFIIQQGIQNLLAGVIAGTSTIESLLADPTMRDTLIAFRNSWFSYMGKVIGEVPLGTTYAITGPITDFMTDFKKVASYNQRLEPSRSGVDMVALCGTKKTFRMLISVLKSETSQTVPSSVAQQIVDALQTNNFLTQYKELQQQYRELTAVLSDPVQRTLYEETRSFASVPQAA